MHNVTITWKYKEKTNNELDLCFILGNNKTGLLFLDKNNLLKLTLSDLSNNSDKNLFIKSFLLFVVVVQQF